MLQFEIFASVSVNISLWGCDIMLLDRQVQVFLPLQCQKKRNSPRESWKFLTA